MYLEHYDLNRKPFGLSPGTDFFWLSEKHKEALATLRYGVLGDLGFLLLTGEVGVGKTALIHRLLSSLDSTTIVAHITDPGLGINDFFRLLAVEFGIDDPFKSKGEFLIILERFLRKADREQKKVLLIVDEAQRINSVLLDQIRVLSNIELADRKLINIFFIGQPEFKSTLMEAANRPIRQRIAIYYHVQPLTETETGQYITHRLKIAGADRQIFKPAAMREIFRISQGYPRSINILCDHALLTGFAAGVRTIDSRIVSECENELNIGGDFDAIQPMRSGAPTVDLPAAKPKLEPVPTPETETPPPQRSKAWAYPAMVTLGIVLVALAGYYFLLVGPSGTMPEREASGPVTRHPLPPATEAEKPPSAPQPAENGIVLAEARPDDADASAPGQTTAEPSPAATHPVPDLSMLTPPAEDTGAGPETAPVQETGPTVVPAPSTTGAATAADWAASRTSPAATDSAPSPTDTAPSTAAATTAPDPAAAPTPPAAGANRELASDRQADSTQAAASPEAPDEAPAMVAEKDEGLAAGQSDGRSDERPQKAPAPSALAMVAPPLAPTTTAVADRPPTAPVQQTAPATRQPADQPAVTDADTPTDSAGAASPPAPPEAPADRPKKADPAPAPAGASPKSDPPAMPAGPAIPATAALIPQDTAGEVAAADRTETKEAVEDRVRSFLQSYCRTYSAKDLDSFIGFFTSDAVENGNRFDKLLPKYQKNFTFIDTIYYRIELQEMTVEDDGETIKIDGNFFLRWLPPDKKWRENAGKIYMTLEKNGSSFLVRRLDYHSHRQKGES